MYADIRGVPWRGGVKQHYNSGVIENVDFRAFERYVVGTLRNEVKIIVLFSTLSPFHWPQNTWSWMAI